MHYSRKAGLALALVGLGAVLGTASVQAQTPGYTITNTTGSHLDNPPFTLGLEFTANSALTVTALGIFDSDQDGLAESHAVGLFDSNGNELTSTTIADGTADPLVNQFRYVAIAPVTLTAGQNYFIGALYTTGNDYLVFPHNATGFATGSSITFVRSTFNAGPTLSDPNTGGSSSPAFFGPNFLMPPAAVPESSSVATFGVAGLGLVGLMLKARKRRPTLGLPTRAG